jgi:hypothetical protein
MFPASFSGEIPIERPESEDINALLGRLESAAKNIGVTITERQSAGLTFKTRFYLGQLNALSPIDRCSVWVVPGKVMYDASILYLLIFFVIMGIGMLIFVAASNWEAAIQPLILLPLLPVVFLLNCAIGKFRLVRLLRRAATPR